MAGKRMTPRYISGFGDGNVRKRVRPVENNNKKDMPNKNDNIRRRGGGNVAPAAGIGDGSQHADGRLAFQKHFGDYQQQKNLEEFEGLSSSGGGDTIIQSASQHRNTVALGGDVTHDGTGPWQLSAIALLAAVVLLSALFLHIITDAQKPPHHHHSSYQNNHSRHNAKKKRSSSHRDSASTTSASARKKDDDVWNEDAPVDDEEEMQRSRHQTGASGDHHHQVMMMMMPSSTVSGTGSSGEDAAAASGAPPPINLYYQPSYHHPHNSQSGYRHRKSASSSASSTSQVYYLNQAGGAVVPNSYMTSPAQRRTIVSSSAGLGGTSPNPAAAGAPRSRSHSQSFKEDLQPPPQQQQQLPPLIMPSPNRYSAMQHAQHLSSISSFESLTTTAQDGSTTGSSSEGGNRTSPLAFKPADGRSPSFNMDFGRHHDDLDRLAASAAGTTPPVRIQPSIFHQAPPPPPPAAATFSGSASSGFHSSTTTTGELLVGATPRVSNRQIVGLPGPHHHQGGGGRRGSAGPLLMSDTTTSPPAAMVIGDPPTPPPPRYAEVAPGGPPPASDLYETISGNSDTFKFASPPQRRNMAETPPQEDEETGSGVDPHEMIPFLPTLEVQTSSTAPPNPVNLDELHLYQMMESGNVSHWEAQVAAENREIQDQLFPNSSRSSNSRHSQAGVSSNDGGGDSDALVGLRTSSTPPLESEATTSTATNTSSNSYQLASNDPRGSIHHKRTNLTSMTDAASSLQGAIEFSELRLVDVIGGGGFGQVWKAIWRGTPVAVKVLTGSAQSRHVPKAVLEEFVAEINLLKGMRHPNICLYMGACLDPPNRAIITELAANGSLWDALRLPLCPPYDPCGGVSRAGWPLSLYRPDSRHGAPPASSLRVVQPPIPPRGSWPWDLVKRVANGAARGMAYLHSGRPPVLHRDLKSANILLDESYSAKVCDFGLSRLKAQERSMTGNCGTVQWMAPEVLANMSYNEKADVFSFGIICWELLTRQCPYDGMTAIQCALAVLNRNQRPDIPKWCPPSLHALIRSCMKKNPDERPTFEQLLQALDAMP